MEGRRVRESECALLMGSKFLTRLMEYGWEWHGMGWDGIASLELRKLPPTLNLATQLPSLTTDLHKRREG